jgi:hypothetical protein
MEGDITNVNRIKIVLSVVLGKLYVYVYVYERSCSVQMILPPVTEGSIMLFVQGGFSVCSPVPRFCASRRPVRRRLRLAYEFCRRISTPDGR